MPIIISSWWSQECIPEKRGDVYCRILQSINLTSVNGGVDLESCRETEQDEDECGDAPFESDTAFHRSIVLKLGAVGFIKAQLRILATDGFRRVG